MFFNKCVLYITYAKERPYYSKKNEQIHIMTLSYYSNKSIFFKADCVRSKHEKHSQDSRENCRVRTKWICQGNMPEHHVIKTCSVMKKVLTKYFFTFSIWCKNRTIEDRTHVWCKLCVDTIAIRCRVQTLYKKRKINKNFACI